MPNQLKNQHQPDDVAAYLGHVARELRVLPLSARDDELREIETHLQAIIEARQSEGRDNVEATAIALAQFGNPRKVGRELRRAWEKKREPWWKSVVAGIGAVVVIQCFNPLWLMLTRGYNYYSFSVPLNTPSLLVTLQPFVNASCYLIPLFAGFLGGAVAPKRAVWGVLLAYTAMCVVDTYVFDGTLLATPLALAKYASILATGTLLGARLMHKRRARIANS